MTVKENAQLIEKIIHHAENSPRFNPDYTEIDELYAFFRVKPESEHRKSLKEIEDALEERLIRSLSRIDTILLREKINELKKYYLYHHIKFGNDVRRIWEYFEGFSDYVRPSKENESNKGKQLSEFCVLKISILSVWITRLRSLRYDNADHFEISKTLTPELWRYANNVLYVENHVTESCIEDGILQNREDVASILFSRIESRIRRYGPVKFLDYILTEYKMTFDSSTEMFASSHKIARKFLYHLALKIVTSPGITEGTKIPETLNAIENIASVLLHLYDYRINNQFQLMFLNEPIEYFQKTVYHDALYKDIQYPPESTIALLDKVLESYRDNIMEIIGIDKEAVIIISKEILSIANTSLKAETPLLRLTAEELCRRLRNLVSRDAITTYLTRLSSNKGLNINFNHPLEVVGIDADSEWLIPVPQKELEYFMPLPSISCFGLYDKIKGLLSHPKSWGTVFEQFIQQWMTTHLGEPVYSGNYVYNGKQAESDGICIVGNHVIILESKIKPLTREARSGHIGKLMLDIGGSFIDSQTQAFRTESALRFGPLDLYESDCDYKAMANGKRTPIVRIVAPKNAVYIRISCTPFHFGTFNENTVCHNIFEALIRYSFATDDESIQERFDVFEKKRKSLLDILGALQKTAYKPDRIFEMTHGSYFLSFGLIYMLTSPKTSTQNALERLRSFGSIQSGDYDSYSILKYILKR